MIMSRAVEKIFIETVRNRNLLPEGAAVTAAVSGGADSVLLLILLNKFRQHMNWDLSVLHIDHGIRENSSEDADFVKTLAGKLDISFSIRTIQLEEKSCTEAHLSSCRSRIYAEVSDSGQLIAVGHTASDRAETLLMRLMEGAGLRGLGGMDYVGIGPVRRPLLDITREQVREYLAANEISRIDDPTNKDNSILRNSIRNIVFPCIEGVKPGSTVAFSRASSGLSEWRDYIDGIVRRVEEELINDSCFSRDAYLELSKVIRLSILWTVAGKPRGGRYEIEKTDRWIATGKDGFHNLPGGIQLTIEGSKITISYPVNVEEKSEF